MLSAWITLARVVRPQGRHGELLCDLHTEFAEQLHGELSLRRSSGDRATVHVESHWFPTGRNAGRIVLKLTGVDTITQAETVAGAEIEIPSDRRLILEEGSFYVTDLIGCCVTDGQASLGTVADIQMTFDRNGRKMEDAPALFVLRDSNGAEILVPFANAFVRRIDVAEKVIEMTLPEGLLELNR